MTSTAPSPQSRQHRWEADSAGCWSPLLWLDVLIAWLGAGPGMEGTKGGLGRGHGRSSQAKEKNKAGGALGSRTAGLAQRLSPPG